MICLNCRRELPDGARSCQFCEAHVASMPEVDVAALKAVADQLPPDVVFALTEAALSCETVAEFTAMIMVGECPVCGSADVEDCEHTAGVEDCTVGRCYACGKFWCLECGAVFPEGQKICEHWGESNHEPNSAMIG